MLIDFQFYRWNRFKAPWHRSQRGHLIFIHGLPSCRIARCRRQPISFRPSATIRVHLLIVRLFSYQEFVVSIEVFSVYLDERTAANIYPSGGSISHTCLQSYALVIANRDCISYWLSVWCPRPTLTSSLNKEGEW